MAPQPRKTIAVFFAKLAAIYLLLAAPWPGLQPGYARLFRGAANAVFGWVGPNGTAAFTPSAAGDSDMDTDVELRNYRDKAIFNVHLDSRRCGYLPTAFQLALVLATPRAWARPWRPLLWGLLLVNAFVLLRIGLFILRNFSTEAERALFHFSPFWDKLLDICLMHLVRHPASYFTVPLIIWLLVTFRARHWEALRKAVTTRTQRRPTK